MFRIVCIALSLSLAMAVGFRNVQSTQECKTKGAGQPEDTKDCACQECKKYEAYLKPGGDDCFCHATDIMGTFENDATKESTKKVGVSEGGSHKNKEVTSNIGAERLPEGWMWHCRPITGTTNPQ